MPPAGIGGTSSLIVATADSGVRNVLATLVAFWSAVLVTFADIEAFYEALEEFNRNR